MIRLVGRKEIVDRELGLYDLLLEVGGELHRHLVGERVALIELYITLQRKLTGQFADLYLEQMLVVDVVRY